MEPQARGIRPTRLHSARINRRELLLGAAATAGALIAVPFAAGYQSTAKGKSSVIMAYGVGLSQLDPHKNGNTVHESVLRNMYECLVAFSADLKSIEPQLATEWRQVNDLTLQFKLRQNVKFHNGEAFDAEVVKFSIHRMLNPETKAPMLSTYRIIDHVDVVDKYTVNMVSKSPDPVLLRRLAGFHTIMVPPGYFSSAKAEELATKPIGTGPYKFVSWAKDADLVMEANTAYWGGTPKVEMAVVRGLPEAGTRVSALQAEDVDIIAAVPPDDVDRINKRGRARVASVAGNRVVFFAMDVSTKPTSERLFRQAVNYGANIDGIIKTVLSGRGYRRATLLNPWHVGYDPSIKPFPYNMDKARALLKEAGFSGGAEVSMHLVQGRLPRDKELGEAIAGELEKVGIRCKINWMDYANYSSQAGAGKLDGIITASWGDFMHDADNSLFTVFHSSARVAKSYMRGYKNAKLDSLLEEARTTLDTAKRRKLYSEAQQVLIDDCPGLFGYAIEDLYGVNNRVDWKPRTDEMVWFKEMSLKG